MKTRRTADEWQTIFNQFADSGLSVKQFCLREKLAPSNFYLWRKRLHAEPEPAFPQDINWQLLTPTQPTQSWDIELELPGGITLRMRR
ncbi:IS66 family insertion sequence element accessory protein TnpA [Motilimonas cestriensis]|uniref:IS66 family insertion sequence element accessory protein TnpA n=1 Tax=Motilimonas cestriensis TaxID=2742685 RepID=UPI003DA2CDC1